MKYQFDVTLDHRFTGSTRWLQPEGREDVIGMGTADLDFACPPCVKEATLVVCGENTFNYRYKPARYYDAIISWFDRKYGLAVQQEWISSIPGTLAAIHMAVRLFGKPGDYVLMQTPYFTPLKAGIEGAGCRFLANPMVQRNGRYELDFDDFEEKIRRYRPSLFLLVNPHNPTGRIFTMEELTQMVDICARYNVRILSDEVHFLITYDGKKHIPIYAVSERAKEISILIFSFSKGFNLMSLPHAVVMIADRAMRERWERFVYCYNFNYASNSFSIAAVTAVAGGSADLWLEELTAYLKENRDHFIRTVSEIGLPITPLKPEAGFLFWIDCSESGIKPEALDRVFLDKAGISLNNGLTHGEDGRGFVRMNFGVTKKTLQTALDRMNTMFDKN